jgi:hypothetical protein
VRAIQIAAFTNKRLSTPYAPGSPFPAREQRFKQIPMLTRELVAGHPCREREHDSLRCLTQNSNSRAQSFLSIAKLFNCLYSLDRRSESNQFSSSF